MNIVVSVLRLIHIAGGVFWVGAVLLNTFFLGPAAAATGEAGQRFVAYLMNEARLSARIALASYLTVLAGAALYWIDSRGFTSGWLTSGPGLGFGIGALAAFIGFGFGQRLGKQVTLIGKLSSQIQGTPTPEQAAALQLARSRMSSAGMFTTGFLIAALILMATARYWHS